MYIIFKHVNSIVEFIFNDVGFIFNEKIIEMWNLWVHKQYMDTAFTVKKSTKAG